MLTKILEPIVYAVAWIYAHTGLRLLGESGVDFFRYLLNTKVRLSIHTFIGASLVVLYCCVFTGHIKQFHAFHDALSMLAVYSFVYDAGMIVIILAIASVALIILSRGFFVFLGYLLTFFVYLILSSFETPKAVEPTPQHTASGIMKVVKTSEPRWG